jgi:hypothetical protein
VKTSGATRRRWLLATAVLPLAISVAAVPSAHGHEFDANGYSGANHGAFVRVGSGAFEESINGAIATFSQPGIEHFDVPQNCGSGIEARVYPTCGNIGANARPMQIGAWEPITSRNAQYFVATGVVAGCANSQCTGIGANGAPYKRW